MDSEKDEEFSVENAELIRKIKAYLVDYYQPAMSVNDADCHFSTLEVYRKLLAIFPNETVFSAFDVSTWLMEAGFICEDFGDMKFEWLLKKINRSFKF